MSSGGGELRPQWRRWLRGENDAGKRGKSIGGSHGSRRDGQRARGSDDGGESTVKILGGRWWRRRRWRRCSASGTSWLGGEDEGVEAELLRVSERRGGGCGCGYGERRRPARSDTRERERGRGEEESGESERVEGGCVASPRGVQASRWSGKQEVAGACAGVRRPRACAYWREEEGERGGSGDWLGRAAGPGGLPGERQVVCHIPSCW